MANARAGSGPMWRGALQVTASISYDRSLYLYHDPFLRVRRLLAPVSGALGSTIILAHLRVLDVAGDVESRPFEERPLSSPPHLTSEQSVRR